MVYNIGAWDVLSSSKMDGRTLRCNMQDLINKFGIESVFRFFYRNYALIDYENYNKIVILFSLSNDRIMISFPSGRRCFVSCSGSDEPLYIATKKEFENIKKLFSY